LNKIKILDECLTKEKTNAMELKLNNDMHQLKNKEYEEKIKSQENRRLEIELNLDKLMEQLK